MQKKSAITAHFPDSFFYKFCHIRAMKRFGCAQVFNNMTLPPEINIAIAGKGG